MKSKLIALVLCIVLCFTLVACNNDDGPDKTSLNETITTCEQYKEADYTAASWTEFSVKLAAAKAVSAKADATQDEIDSVTGELNAAVSKLVTKTTETADKTNLNAAIAMYKTRIETDYTIDSWTAFSEKLADAEEIAAKNDAPQTEINNAYNELITIAASLVSVAEINVEIAKYKEPNYTVDSWTTFSPKFTVANDIAKKSNATQEEIDNALNDLKAAALNLIYVSGKTALNEAIAECEIYQETDYTSASWTASQFSAKLDAAKAISAKEDATQEEINTALNELNFAASKLARIANKTALNGIIDLYNQYKEADYTNESWSAFSAKLTAAKTVKDDNNATQSEVDTALLELTAAADGLLERPQPQILNPVLSSAGILTFDCNTEGLEFFVQIYVNGGRVGQFNIEGNTYNLKLWTELTFGRTYSIKVGIVGTGIIVAAEGTYKHTPLPVKSASITNGVIKIVCDDPDQIFVLEYDCG